MVTSFVVYKNKYGHEIKVHGSVTKQGLYYTIYDFDNHIHKIHRSQIRGIKPIDLSKKRILYLTVTKKWFDMISKGIKNEEYREIKPYWIKRLENNMFDYIVFRNGYGKKVPEITIECNGILIGIPNEKWFYGDVSKNVFIIILGDIISRKMVNFSSK